MSAVPSVIVRWVWDLLEIEKLPKLRPNLRLRLVTIRTAKNILLSHVDKVQILTNAIFPIFHIFVRYSHTPE
jgi:hypothetical protein